MRLGLVGIDQAAEGAAGDEVRGGRPSEDAEIIQREPGGLQRVGVAGSGRPRERRLGRLQPGALEAPPGGPAGQADQQRGAEEGAESALPGGAVRRREMRVGMRHRGEPEPRGRSGSMRTAGPARDRRPGPVQPSCMTRGAGRADPCAGPRPRGRSVGEGVARDGLAALDRAQRLPGADGDAVLDELHRAVQHQHVHPARVVRAGADDACRSPAALQPCGSAAGCE